MSYFPYDAGEVNQNQTNAILLARANRIPHSYFVIDGSQTRWMSEFWWELSLKYLYTY